MERLTFTAPQAAEVIGVSARTYYQQAARGQVPAVRVGRRLVVPAAQLERFLQGERGVPSKRDPGGERPPGLKEMTDDRIHRDTNRSGKPPAFLDAPLA